ILIDLLSPAEGLVNKMLNAFGMQSIYFLGDNRYFRGTLIVTDVWKNFGYGTIVYLASMTSIDPTLYEAAQIDGANRWQQTWHITLTGIRVTIAIMLVLALGRVLSAGFDQTFNLYNNVVYETGDILDTFVYRLGLEQAAYGPATAVGLFKSLVSLILVSISYAVAVKWFDYQLF
ncbi:MAG: sugar ABC transporter permease, partial [Clostridia bacterium]|nr:sugar ABC transporter permease [Clostridia bacterium]